jgi:phenylpropionate dioxygenase-like ring-hydroxylating dioxygenase large terminal subunit
MSNVCLHRWAPVASGAGNAKRFSCPFHRWGYDLDGRLATTPLMDQAADFDIASCRLPEIRSEIVNGTIFATFSASAPSVGETLADWVAALAPYKPEDMTVAFTTEFDLDFNWKIVVETFMEAYHHIGAHAKTLEPLFPAALHWVDDTRAGWTAGHGYLKPDLPTPAANRSGLPEFPNLTEDQRRRSLCHLVYPNHTLFITVDKITWTAVIPVGPAKTKWIRHALVLPEARQLPNFAEIVGDIRSRGLDVNQEDIGVNRLQQRGAASSYARAGRLCHLEKPVWQLANYIRDRIRA